MNFFFILLGKTPSVSFEDVIDVHGVNKCSKLDKLLLFLILPVP